MYGISSICYYYRLSFSINSVQRLNCLGVNRAHKEYSAKNRDMKDELLLSILLYNVHMCLADTLTPATPSPGMLSVCLISAVQTVFVYDTKNTQFFPIAFGE